MEDKQLIASCLRGEAEEFKKIVERYSGSAMALALNILGNREDAEDVCQEAFVQAYRHLGKFDFKRSFKNWLYTILYRRCLDQLRKSRRFSEIFKKIKTESSESFRFKASNQQTTSPLPSNILRHLTPKERTALCLWANEDYSAREISEVLECSSSTVRVCLFSARKKIRALLEKKNVSLENY